jgi:hypothetical protein
MCPRGFESSWLRYQPGSELAEWFRERVGRVFETYEAIIDAACEAWNKLIALPDTISSIETRAWAHVGTWYKITKALARASMPLKTLPTTETLSTNQSRAHQSD